MEFGVWWGLAAGPISWAISEGLNYALTQHACSTGHVYVLRVTSIVFFLLALSGFASSSAANRGVPENARVKGHAPKDRAYFLSMVGIVTSLFFALIVAAESIPHWVMSPCS
ncbi:MAG: hypothetical protein JOZ44_16520 [Acidobacteria bacterium]|nr:hypothetical protein [Acidobacteriota bacterium]